MKFIKYIFLSLVASSCAQGVPLNIMLAKEHVVHYYESGNFEADCATMVDNALVYLQDHEHAFDESKTIVFDIDDTLLLYFEHLKSVGFCAQCPQCNYNAYYNWLEKGNAVEVRQIKRLYDYAAQYGYHIVFLSGRPERYKEETIKNLALHGYTVFDRIILRSEAEKGIPIARFKAQWRAALVESGYSIVASVGDQPTDFVGGNTGYVVHIPNYLYISR